MKGAPDINHLFSTFAKGKAAGKKEAGINAVIYTRVSTKEQAENNMSLHTQKRACAEHCARTGWRVIGEFGGTYESAAKDERKEFNRMMDFVKKSKVPVSFIVVYSPDRFSRTGANAIHIAHTLRERGIHIQAVTQPTDTATPSGVLQQNIQFIFSQFDNELRRQKVAAGIKERLLQGKSYGFDPRGYKREYSSAREYRLVLNDEGKLLRKAFQWKAAGELTNKQIIQKLGKMGMRIIEQQLSKIFHNPFYCGLIVNRMLEGQVIQGQHEPCVSQELFLQVNGVLQCQNNHGWKVNEKNEAMPLKRFMRCSVCNGPLSGYLVNAKGLHYYKCKNHSCRTTKRADDLNTIFAEMLKGYRLDPSLQEAVMFELAHVVKEANREGAEQRTAMELQLAEKRKVVEDMEERHALGKIDSEVFQKYRAKYLTEVTDLQAEILKMRETDSNQDRYLEAYAMIAANPHELWARQDYEGKQLLQSIIFPEGLVYDKKNDMVLTPRVNEVFRWSATAARALEGATKGNRRAKTAKSLSAEREGFEPSKPFWSLHAFQASPFDRSGTSPLSRTAKIGKIPALRK